MSSSPPNRGEGSQASSADYGPVRRVQGKTPTETLFRFGVMLQDDFAEMMQDALPELIAHALRSEALVSQVLTHEVTSEASCPTLASLKASV